MGCKPMKCIVCGGNFPACQIQNGMCAACRGKKQEEEKQKLAEKQATVKTGQ